MAPISRSTRRGKYFRQASKHISYKEDDSFTSGSENEDHENDMSASDHRSRTTTTRSSLGPNRSTTKASARKRKNPRSDQNAVKKAKKVLVGPTIVPNSASDLPVLQEGIIPPWQELPYDILASIFRYTWPAPKIDQLSWNTWLLRIALLCKSFSEPALSALYYAPTLRLRAQTEGLLRLLTSQTTELWLNYRAKVKYLLLKPIPRCGGFFVDLNRIVALTPQLRGVQSWNNASTSYVEVDEFIKGLERSSVSLRELRWIDFNLPFRYMYPTSSLRSLESLTFNGLVKYPISRGYVQWGAEEFASSVNALPQLKHLSINLSLLQCPEILSLLSTDLESLDLMECQYLDRGALATYLATRGQQLRRLRLQNYSTFDYSFLVNLARSCPRLQDLGVDFTSDSTYYGLYITDEPGLEIPRPDVIPTWPSSLRFIELLHIRNWNLSSTDMFFSSLVESAASLPDLRHIHIKASLGESEWKSRVRFREKWTARFMHVFLRLSKPPNPYLRSLGAYRAFKSTHGKSAVPLGNHDSQSPSSGPTLSAHRQASDKGSDWFRQVAIESHGQENNEDATGSTVTQHRSKRRSARLKQSAGNSLHSPSPSPPRVRKRRRHRRRAKGSDSDFSSEDSALEDEVQGPLADDTNESYESFHVQGLCDVVHVQFDNLRPRDEQLRESDFLDEERSGDEDWKGDDSDEE